MEQETDFDMLAGLVADGFSDMSARFDRLERGAQETNRRIDAVVIPTIDDHSRRIKDLELAR